MSVAIIEGDFHSKHSTSWSREWLRACQDYSIEHELINWRQQTALDRILRHQVVLWHVSHYSHPEMTFGRTFLYALESTGRRVFPGSRDVWHYDDKVAQSLLFRCMGVSTPQNHVFFDQSSLDLWLRSSPSFPVVAKLRTGSGSANVHLLHSPRAVRAYARKMFSKGCKQSPSPIFKTWSNIQSVTSLHELFHRARRIPEFAFSYAQSRSLPRERGYVYLQDFVPNALYDIKVVVVGDKLSFIGRGVRKGDFRASGGGDISYDRQLMSKSVVDVGFSVATALKSRCVGIDVVVNPETAEPTVLEVSFGFSHHALLQAQGYYDRGANWHDIPLNAPRDILLDLARQD